MPKIEDSEEAKEVSEAPKTSEVKVEVKTEGEIKDNSEAVAVDEDQRKLFVGGLAQVFISPFPEIIVAFVMYPDIYFSTSTFYSSILSGGKRH